MILLNDDYTPREFVVMVLKAVFRMNEDQAYNVMMTAHQRGACVIAVFTKDVADTKAKEATELGKSKGYPAVLHHRAGGVTRKAGAGKLPCRAAGLPLQSSPASFYVILRPDPDERRAKEGPMRGFNVELDQILHPASIFDHPRTC